MGEGMPSAVVTVAAVAAASWQEGVGVTLETVKAMVEAEVEVVAC